VSGLPGVWADLVGQDAAVIVLAGAAAAAARVGDGRPGNRAQMAQTWLLTGPPGSGRSTAGRAFAAALQCISPLDGTDDGSGYRPVYGCGRCNPCRTVRAGTHPDLVVVATESLSLKVKDIRALVRDAAMAPTAGRWLVVVVEDADRLTDDAADALLKSVEEPPPHTVWVLCAPTVDDVPPTIRSRARHLQLRTPPVDDVAAFLVARHGADPATALTAARSAQGHIGRARALALDPGVRARHEAVLDVAGGLTDPAACARAAADLVQTATDDAAASTTAAAERETARLRHQLGLDDGARADRYASAALRDLAEEQKARAKRAGRDHLDRALVDLAAWYRDVLARQLGATGPATNAHRDPQLGSAAAAGTPESTLRRIDAVLAARRAVAANVAPLLAVEAMALQILVTGSAPQVSGLDASSS
jgi:DNA polymerase-3 subunit delta'